MRLSDAAPMSDPGSQPGRARGSIRRRLPLLISALLAAAVAAFGWAAYLEVERALLEASRQRLLSVSRQLATLLTQSLQQRVDEGRRLAAEDAIRQAIATADPAAARAVQARLGAFVTANPQTLGVEVWNGAGQRVAAARPPNRPPASQSGAPRTLPPFRTEAPSALGFTPLQVANDLVYYDLVAPVIAAQSASGSGAASPPPRGYVVLRRGASAPGTAEAVARLIGGGLSVQFGARGAGVWTDLSKVVAAPPVPETAGTVTEYRDAQGQDTLGAAAPMAGAPWLVWVAMPRQAALAPARAFLGRMAPLGGIVVILGAAVAWGLARRITRPLHELMHAVEAISAGDYSGRVAEAGRRDEIGRLGVAFNTMTAHVQDSYAKLDARVRERTSELEQAVKALEDAQDQLVRREKLATLGQLASGVGHELRNPLGVMTNAVYYLEMVQASASAEVREYHGILRAQIGLAEKIVSDLLDFASIKAPRREAVSLAQLVDDQLARLTVPDEVRVEKDLPADLPAAHIDPVQIGQIVFNLLVNAFQAMEDRGGVLTIRGRAVAEGVVLDVIDTGPGVAADVREKIFEPLFTTKARGIGLGLAVSRGLAEANGGRLTLSSVPGIGATFTLALPIRAEARA
jgi:signal transduction histidine kinase